MQIPKTPAEYEYECTYANRVFRRAEMRKMLKEQKCKVNINTDDFVGFTCKDHSGLTINLEDNFMTYEDNKGALTWELSKIEANAIKEYADEQ